MNVRKRKRLCQGISDSELIDKYYKTGNMLKKVAIASILQDRGYVPKDVKWLKL
ncbi:hypothetical protein [Pseudobacteroides sp.]|uniref:hypothetical protein n=1 Tax=Pseudobacteroides sp. TaxID=1968840 RepID=UPI002F94B054